MTKGFDISTRRFLVHRLRSASWVLMSEVGENKRIVFRHDKGRFTGNRWILSVEDDTRATVLAFVETDAGRLWVARRDMWASHGLRDRIRESLSEFNIGTVVANAGGHHEQIAR